MDIATSRAGDSLVVRVNDTRIDASVAIAFKEAVRRAADAAGNPVILDLGRVRFIDSSGLGAVVAVMKLLAPDRKLELAALTPPVDKVFRLTRMDSVFTIHPQPPGDLQATA
ncbi:STAS domain-containing protein [Pararhodobacter marinus]|uniref:Anti-sigma factor antagonist n=1 Tax=Pararhodobacter marinus TaxID=2184063 RepID=A0A2U2CI38_9RHOB|nr:STAS domain-containing protein [Pararhodobacter marinus]PWE31532.1 anti-sigma factor antagonist [Pararhodobacter marinus]